MHATCSIQLIFPDNSTIHNSEYYAVNCSWAWVSWKRNETWDLSYQSLSCVDWLIDWLIDYNGVRLTSHNRDHHWPTVHPRVNVRGEPWWWLCRLGITPDLPTRALWRSYQQKHLERGGGIDEGMRILLIQYFWYVHGYFTCCKILRLYFPSERTCAADFYRP
jgi:hypothetical protein